MTPWLRTTGLLLVLGTGAMVNPCGGAPAYGAVLAYEAVPARGVEAGSGAGAGGAGGGRVAVAGPASPFASATASAADSASASALRPAAGPDAAHASPDPSRAGNLAGEGRERPGRTAAEPTTDEDEGGDAGEGDDTAGPTADGDDDGSQSDNPGSPTPADSPSAQEADPVPTSPPLQPLHHTVTHAEDPTEPVLRILPLGSGLILIGLGLGLAFIALRVRRS
ncbi:hypothetical protein OG588_25365 [Streptomyces prunicolor]|uniref:hypothetical protein n=1 Tax=Streptomyces prunicolor TaxID=67348 RepID=UPI00386AF863|nr:hypothetical protein OG588_25365 [Streptomyces prunicolor]